VVSLAQVLGFLHSWCVVGLKRNRLARGSIADEIISWRELPQGFELLPGVIQRVRLGNPERTSVLETAENIEAENHVLVNWRLVGTRDRCLFKIEQTKRQSDR
jgi:hypothetical protein